MTMIHGKSKLYWRCYDLIVKLYIDIVHLICYKNKKLDSFKPKIMPHDFFFQMHILLNKRIFTGRSF